MYQQLYDMTRTSYDQLYPPTVPNFLYAFHCCCCIIYDTRLPYCIVSIVGPNSSPRTLHLISHLYQQPSHQPSHSLCVITISMYYLDFWPGFVIESRCSNRKDLVSPFLTRSE